MTGATLCACAVIAPLSPLDDVAEDGPGPRRRAGRQLDHRPASPYDRPNVPGMQADDAQDMIITVQI